MKKKQKNKQLITVQEAVRELHELGFSITSDGIRAESKAGRLRVHTIQGRDYLAREDLDAYVSQKWEAPDEIGGDRMPTMNGKPHDMPTDG